MDIEAALEAVRSQDLRLCERLVTYLHEAAREGDAHADALAPWLGRSWKRNPTAWLESDAPWLNRSRRRNFIVNLVNYGNTDGLGRLKEDAERIYLDARSWLYQSVGAWESRGYAKASSWVKLQKAVRGISYFGPSERTLRNLHGSSLYADVPDGGFTRREVTERAVRQLHDHIRELTALLRGQQPDRMLSVPDVLQHPRQGKIKPGLLGRILAEDIASEISKGRDLLERLTRKETDWTEAQSWIKEADALLQDSLSIFGYYRLDKSIEACQSPLVDDPFLLARAYAALTISYLEEVQAHMPDYIEASGQQSPEPSFIINGGNFYGSQFATRISNINLAVAGIRLEGRTDIADALRAIQQAVLADGLDDDQRADLIDSVEYLAQAAEAPPEERNRGIARAALAALSGAAASGTALSAALESWGSVLHRLFG